MDQLMAGVVIEGQFELVYGNIELITSKRIRLLVSMILSVQSVLSVIN